MSYLSMSERSGLETTGLTISLKTGRSLLASVLFAAFVSGGLVAASPAFAQKNSAQKSSKKVKQNKKGKRARVKPVSASKTIRRIQDKYKAKLNQNTVTLMSGCCTTGAYTAFGADIKDMVARVGDKEGLRVLSVLGGGAGTNVRDILYLRGVDMAILNTDVIDYYKDRPLYENLTKRIQYITKLFNEEVHLYGGKNVNSLSDLDGKLVGFNNSSAEVTGLVLFEKLGITPSDTIRITEADGALALKEGRLDAMMRVTGKPIRNVTRLKGIFPGIKLVPINYDPAFIGSHLPTQLTHKDYPDLIAEGKPVATIATRTILAVFNWKPRSDRYRRLEKFTSVFFEHFTKLRESRNLHPKWAEVNLQATVPGLTRFTPAQNWLDKKTTHAKRQVEGKTKKAQADLMKSFKQFLASRAPQQSDSTGDVEPTKLFGEFVRWQKKNR